MVKYIKIQVIHKNMKNLVLVIAATMMFAACSPTEVELVKPQLPNIVKPTPDPVKPGDQPGSGQVDNPTEDPSEFNDFNNNRFWIMYKNGKYELLNKETDKREQFDITTTERLLRMPGTVWEIPADAPYIFSFESGLRFDRTQIK